jgi:hypothetical protein
LRAVPILYLFSHLIFSDSIALPNFRLKLLTVSIDEHEIVIGEISPSRPDLSLGGGRVVENGSD